MTFPTYLMMLGLTCRRTNTVHISILMTLSLPHHLLHFTDIRAPRVITFFYLFSPISGGKSQVDPDSGALGYTSLRTHERRWQVRIRPPGHLQQLGRPRPPCLHHRPQQLRLSLQGPEARRRLHHHHLHRRPLWPLAGAQREGDPHGQVRHRQRARHPVLCFPSYPRRAPAPCSSPRPCLRLE